MNKRPCETVKLELLGASNKVIETTNEVARLVREKPAGWQDLLAEASKRKAEAQEVFRAKTDAYFKCRDMNLHS